VRSYIAKNPTETAKIHELVSMLDEEHQKEFESYSMGNRVQFVKQDAPLMDWSA